MKKRRFQFKDKNEPPKFLIENKAVFDKQCVVKYNKSKLALKRNLFEKEHKLKRFRKLH